jgi:hypothetical protein
VVFFAVKDMTHGIIGIPAGENKGGYYDPGFKPEKT